MAPALILPLIRIILRRVGEPVKSVIKPAEMRALLSPYGFTARDDQSLFELAPDLPSHAARALRVMSHLRIVVAERS